MSYDTSRKETAGVARALSVPWNAVAAIVLGFAIIYAVGFASPETIHNAAHDTRHSLNFPCH